jgi:hypothetical protein
MFVVRVLPGDYAPGSTSFVRPPPRNPKDPFELFDRHFQQYFSYIVTVSFIGGGN